MATPSPQPQSLLQQHASRSGISLDSAWDDLKPGIVTVLKHEDMKKDRYLQLYNLVYLYCTSCSVSSATNYRQREIRSTEFLGRELYGKLTKFLQEYLQSKSKEGSDKRNEDILGFYSDNWKYFTFSSQVIHNIFLYLNRHWVRREMEDGNKKVFEIYSLSLVQWRDAFLGSIRDFVNRAVLKMIEDDRNGKAIESKFITCIVQSYVELGVENSPTSRGRVFTFYEENLEKHFMNETKAYYQKESSEFLKNHTVSEYVKKAYNRLVEEKSRAERYLHERTLVPLIAQCEEILIMKYQSRFNEEFSILLKEDRKDDIAHMYKLLVRKKECLMPLKNILQNHIKKQGLDAVEAIKDKAFAEPQVYARQLLKVLHNYKGMVIVSFSNDPIFVQALDDACSEFINSNSVTLSIKQSLNTTPKLLAQFCNILLNKKSKATEEDELEDTLQQLVILLHYVTEKDVFQKHYSNLLARRLVDNLSTSDDAERSMISKLKDAFGQTFTNNLEKMFKDMELSKTLNQQFRNHIQTLNTRMVDFGVQVITQGYWPYSDTGLLALPTEIDVCIQKFTAFYSAQHGSRKLSWNYKKSNGDITGRFKKIYTFSVSTYQMVVLLQFNHFQACTFEQIQHNTLIEEDVLEQVIRTLLKTKLLVGEGISSDENASISRTADIRVNQDYNNKKVRININVPLRLETTQEEETTNRTIEDERMYEIQAAIVRVMKMRKTLIHNELITEVINQLKARFKPKIPAMKLQIEKLIERDYIARVKDTKDRYNYVA